MSEITSPVLTDSTFAEKMAKTNALLGAMVRENMPTTLDWAELEDIANDGIFDSVYAIGDQFVDTWTDTEASKDYSFPWGFVHSEDVELADGETLTNRPFLQMHYAHPFGVQFSHHRAFLACPDGLSAGTYTIHFAQVWSKMTQLAWYFTLTQDVPAGGRLAGFYTIADSTSYKVYSYSADGKTVIETVTPVAGESGTNLGTCNLNTRNGNLNSMQETGYGWNRWKTSALRQYLNSDAGVGSWWTAQDAWDIAPDQLTTKAGFLSGCADSFKEIIKPVKVTTYTNTVQDGGAADITYDKVWLPSLQQIYVNPQIQGEGNAFGYWKRRSGSATPLSQGGTYPNMITYAVENHSSAQNVALRSCYRSYASLRWRVYSSGDVGTSYAYGAYRFSPLVVI